jgi:hypothetical protein
VINAGFSNSGGLDIHGSWREFAPGIQLQIRQAEAKRLIFAHRSGAYIKVREHRSAENLPLQPGITKNATVY